jgi:asparagine synthetase B (glutamine-hydrolysing)
MCDIVGIIGSGEIAPLLVESISRLEYRGYDSCGLATLNSVGIELRQIVLGKRETGHRTHRKLRRRGPAAQNVLPTPHLSYISSPPSPHQPARSLELPSLWEEVWPGHDP